MRAWLVVLGTLAIVLAAARARAHTVGLSTGEWRRKGTDVEASLVFARAELVRLVPLLDANGDGHVTAAEVHGARPQLRARVLDRIEVHAGGARCAATITDAAIVEGDGLVVAGRWSCRGAPPDRVELALLADLPRGHRHVARVVAPSGTHDRVLGADAVAVDLGPPEPLGGVETETPRDASSSSLLSFVELGLEHILTGFDHLLFVAALVLVPSRLRSLAGTVTAFTIAHSVTLAVATFGTWTPPSRLVEPAIALSIAYVGVETFFLRDGRGRWRVTFPFGLVHGFGFAGALRELSLPAEAIPRALFGFNAGVEIGQLAVLAVVLPVVTWLRERPWFATRGVRAAAVVVTASGLVWFVARLASGG